MTDHRCPKSICDQFSADPAGARMSAVEWLTKLQFRKGDTIYMPDAITGVLRPFVADRDTLVH